MATPSRKETFLRALDDLRSGPKRPEPVDIARLAIETGLEPQAALVAIRDYFEFRYSRSSDLADALSTLISSLCNRAGSAPVLEYTSQSLLLIAPFAGSGGAERMTVVTRNAPFAEALRILFEKQPMSILGTMSELPPSSTYASIVCAPPIGHREPHNAFADGFGGEVVHALLPYLAEDGMLYWVTARGAVFNPKTKQTLDNLKSSGLNMTACIETAPGAFSGTMIEGVVFAFQRRLSSHIFVAVLREEDTAPSIAAALQAGPTKKRGPTWCWTAFDNFRTFSDIEQDRLLQSLVPHGRYSFQSVGSLLLNHNIEKADKPISREADAPGSLYVPEYATSRVTATLEEQSVKAKAVYRLRIDPRKANAQFLARIFNSRYGKLVRARSASGATIRRLPVSALLEIELPLPDRVIQDRVVRIDSDVGLLHAALQEVQQAIEHDWTELPEIEETTDRLKSVLDIERRIADWSAELPYPLATIYRRYSVSTAPKDRLDTILHFFEMAAIYLAAIGTSYVRAMKSEWRDVLAKWLHPSGGAGIERSDLGFWITLAAASLKDVSRIFSDKELRQRATEMAGPELVQQCKDVGELSKAIAILEVAKNYRNSWKAHGGHMKPSDAERLDAELQQSIRDFYEVTSSIFRHIHLVRPGMAEITDTEQMKFQVEILCGSDPTFRKLQIELSRLAKTNALAFWKTGARTMCRAIPFFRLGAPQRPQETSFYVFNRIENGAFRWISYQEAQEQEVYAVDDELSELIALGRTN